MSLPPEEGGVPLALPIVRRRGGRTEAGTGANGGGVSARVGGPAADELEVVLAVSAVLVDSGRLLVVRRSAEGEPAQWAVPGGKVEPGESVEDAVAREVLEETNLRVVAGQLVGFAERPTGEPRRSYVILAYSAELADPTRADADLVAGDDAAAAAWVPLADVRELPLVSGLADFLASHGIL